VNLKLPVLPLRELVVFPTSRHPLRVGRVRSICGLQRAFGDPKRQVVLVAQVDRRVEEPGASDLFAMGVLARIVEPDAPYDDVQSVWSVVVEGISRVRILGLSTNDRGIAADVEVVRQTEPPAARAKGLRQRVIAKVDQLVREGRSGIDRNQLLAVGSLAVLTDMVAEKLDLDLLSRQELVEELDVTQRVQSILRSLDQDIADARFQRRQGGRRAGGPALADAPAFDDSHDALRARVASAELPADARERVERELQRLERMPAASGEANVLRGWVESVLELPWGVSSHDHNDLRAAHRVLDEDHCGLDEPKARMLEYLAVRSQVREARGPILCLSGPPGVGKTSLARSVARALGRQFVRIALGGVHDEAQVRGHRRTYVGAMPGRIVQSLQRVGTMNPVILLDELDKLSTNFRGDPAAALLEVLDPQQNKHFVDHYVQLDLDLSGILFLCTANDVGAIPAALRDRLEIIHLSGYTEQEKSVIARQHLVPRQAQQAGLDPAQVGVTQDGLNFLIRRYTREAGVRSLERAIGSCLRKITRRYLEAEPDRRAAEGPGFRLTPKRIARLLGKPLFSDHLPEFGERPGLCNGLAWSEYGGSVLHVEVALLPGTGKIETTGKLGEVMRESVSTALSYIRAHADDLGLTRDWYRGVDVHLHVPAGGIPKEGPSAGIAIATALASALLDAPVRGDVAMTGEVTLRGRVLPVGGIKEKLLAAHRHGLRTVVFPADNERDLDDLPAEIRAALELVPVHWVEEVWRLALNRPGLALEPLSSNEGLGLHRPTDA
jgi:ATP-dependent Lon protease